MLIDYGLLGHQPHEILSKVCKYLDLEISTAELNRLTQHLRTTHCNGEQKSIPPPSSLRQQTFIRCYFRRLNNMYFFFLDEHFQRNLELPDSSNQYQIWDMDIFTKYFWLNIPSLTIYRACSLQSIYYSAFWISAPNSAHWFDMKMRSNLQGISTTTRTDVLNSMSLKKSSGTHPSGNTLETTSYYLINCCII